MSCVKVVKWLICDTITTEFDTFCVINAAAAAGVCDKAVQRKENDFFLYSLRSMAISWD